MSETKIRELKKIISTITKEKSYSENKRLEKGYEIFVRYSLGVCITGHLLNQNRLSGAHENAQSENIVKTEIFPMENIDVDFMAMNEAFLMYMSIVENSEPFCRPYMKRFC